MPVDHIRYDILTQEALRGVVRSVLEDTAKNGLPGEHHFYITFDTRAKGVRLPARLLAQFPEEMTIVLQHQFWDLTVNADGFEVGMSFGGIAERLAIPFAAIKGFVDPSVPFGVKFELATEAAATADSAQSAAAPAKCDDAAAARPPAAPKPEPKSESRPARATPSVAAAPTPVSAPAEETSDDGPDKPAGGAEVVRLDRFRKK